MNVDTDSFDCRDLPLFLACTQRLLSSLLTMSLDQLRVLWKCSEPLARQNYERLHRINLYANLTPLFWLTKEFSTNIWRRVFLPMGNWNIFRNT